MIDIASAAVGLIATVAAAAMIRSYWALWLGGFVGVVAGRTLAWRASRWRPSLKISFAGSGQLIRFGGAITGFKLLNFLQRNLDTILIGRVWGSATLGLYDRSYKLMMFPLQNINAPLSRVLIPVLARLQDEPERFRRSFLLTLRCILLVSIPPIAVASATSERLVPLLLGDQWSGATPIFFWLCFVALFQPLTNTLGWLFIASGRGRALLHWGAFSALVTVAAFAVGIRWGAVGIAISYLISSAAKVPIVLPWAVRGTSVRTLDLYLTSTPYFASAAIIYLSVDWARPHFSILPLIFIAIPAAYTVACIFTCLSSNGRDAIRSLVRFGRSLLGARMVKSTIPQSGQY